MIEKLRAEFPSLVIEDILPQNPEMVYFRLEDGRYVGINKEEITEKDKTLLSIFLSPIIIDHNLPPHQSMWQQLLLNNDSEVLLSLRKYYDNKTTFRMIHFQLQNEVEKLTFEEALSSLSLLDSTVIWLSPTNGLIIEQVKQDKITPEELMDLRNAIASDFYTDSFFYTGNAFSLEVGIRDLFEWETHCFQLARTHFKSKGVYQFFELFPFLLLQESKSETKVRIQHLVQEVSEDELQTIKTFIESGLNISLSAKKLFMHRNSLQYRVEKFIEKTGIDIKSFQGAIVVYLAILANED
jgi:sugar diacid utilization regulator